MAVPYAERIEVDGAEYAKCPMCGQHIRLQVRKDFESFSGAEYAQHVEVNHPERVVRFGS